VTLAPALTAATGSPVFPPFDGEPSLETGRRCQRLSSRKEASRVVGGHCSGGLPANNGRARGLAPANAIACGACVETGAAPPSSAPLSAASARDGDLLAGPERPAAGGSLADAPAGTLISQTKTGRDALNVPA